MDFINMAVDIAAFLITGLLGLVLYFMKETVDEAKADIIKLHTQIEQIKETFYRKEDFRDFKEELFQRLDRMETSFERKIQEVANEKRHMAG